MRHILIAVLALACGCGGGAGDGRVAITYWRTLTGSAGDAQDVLAARFNDARDDMRVTVQFQGSYADLAGKLMTAASANRGPDVAQLGTFEIRQFAQSGLLLDLRPYLEGPDGIDLDAWPGTIARAGEVDGGIYWIPFNVSVPVLFYNREALAEAGLDGPPETWDAFFEAARSLTTRDASGGVTREGAAFWNITWPFYSMIWSEGGELTNADHSDITLNHPVAVEVMERVRDLVAEGAASLPDRTAGGHRAAFINGRAAMILDSPAALQDIFAQAQGFTPAVALYPGGKAGRVYAPGGGGLVIPATTPEDRREAAWAFIRHLVSADSLAYYARETGYLAFTPDALESDKSLLAEEPYATLHRALPHIRGDFSITSEPAVRNAFDEAFQKIVVAGEDPKAALDEADRRAEEGVRNR
jgi:sn-glycerol 3-phosphate transport system substrate-binding protein